MGFHNFEMSLYVCIFYLSFYVLLSNHNSRLYSIIIVLICETGQERTYTNQFYQVNKNAFKFEFEAMNKALWWVICLPLFSTKSLCLSNGHLNFS